MSSFNLTKIVGGINNTVSIFNKAIPIYKEVTPIVKNVRNTFKNITSVNNAVKASNIKEIKSMERPISNFTKHNKKEVNIGSLTFFN